MDRTERFYKIQRLLQARGTVRLADLLRDLGVSRATFKRDLEYMRDRMNAPIEWDREKRGYRFVAPAAGAPRYELPGLWFSPEEIRALLTMQHLLASLQPGLLEPHVKPLLARLRAALGAGEHPADEIERRIRIIHLGARKLALPHFERVASAVLNRQQAAHRLCQPRIERAHRARDQPAAARPLSRELVLRRVVPSARRLAQLRRRCDPVGRAGRQEGEERPGA